MQNNFSQIMIIINISGSFIVLYIRYYKPVGRHSGFSVTEFQIHRTNFRSRSRNILRIIVNIFLMKRFILRDVEAFYLRNLRYVRGICFHTFLS